MAGKERSLSSLDISVNPILIIMNSAHEKGPGTLSNGAKEGKA
jgi:hypothetical protein